MWRCQQAAFVLGCTASLPNHSSCVLPPLQVFGVSESRNAVLLAAGAAAEAEADGTQQCAVEVGAAHQQQRQEPLCEQSDSACTPSPDTADAAEGNLKQAGRNQQMGGATASPSSTAGSSSGMRVDFDSTASTDAGRPAEQQPSCSGVQAQLGQGSPQHRFAVVPEQGQNNFPAAPAATATEAQDFQQQQQGCAEQQWPLSGPEQSQAQQRKAPGAALRPGCLSAAMHSEPCPNGSTGGGRALASASSQRKVMCASVDDLYQELFGDVPLPSTCSSAAQSPYGGHLSNIRGVSSMSPMTTSSAFCHQQAAAAAILGTGCMQGMGGMSISAAASPVPTRHNSNSQCGSFDGNSGSVFGAGGSYGDCAGSSTGQNVQATAMDDLLPPGEHATTIGRCRRAAPLERCRQPMEGCRHAVQCVSDDQCCMCSSCLRLAGFPQDWD